MKKPFALLSLGSIACGSVDGSSPSLSTTGGAPELPATGGSALLPNTGGMPGCDWQNEPRRCEVLAAVFGGGEVIAGAFAEGMQTFF